MNEEEGVWAKLYGEPPAKEYTDEEEAVWVSLYGPPPRRPMTDEEAAIYNAVYDWSNVPENERPANMGTLPRN